MCLPWEIKSGTFHFLLDMIQHSIFFADFNLFVITELTHKDHNISGVSSSFYLITKLDNVLRRTI